MCLYILIHFVVSQQTVKYICNLYREDEVCDLHNPVYTGASGVEPPNESLPAEYTIPVPAYEVVSPMSETPLSLTTEQHEYDVISQQQRQAEVVSQADETEDYSRLQH